MVKKNRAVPNEDCFCVFGRGGQGPGHPTAQEYIDYILKRTNPKEKEED